MDKYENIFAELAEKIKTLISESKNMENIIEIKNKYLSKKGEFSLLTGKIKEAEDKKAFGEAFNNAKNSIEEVFNQKLKEFEAKKLEEQLKKEEIDITLPGNNLKRGSENPFYKVQADPGHMMILPCPIFPEKHHIIIILRNSTGQKPA